MNLDRKFVLFAFAYAIAGMAVGIYMAASKNHSVFVAHAHILLVGFVVSFVYALVHKLWLSGAGSMLATVQFWLHQAGALLMSIGLVLLYGGMAAPEKLDPLLAASSIAVLGAAILMTYMVARAPARA